jgi:hypothetical protein
MRGPPHVDTGVGMSAQGRRLPLICSVLLGALVISCGGPPIHVVAPAPQGGLQEAAPPAQAAPAPPAPEAVAPLAPRAAPAAPPRRPGGAPPGTERVTLPGGNVTLKKWKEGLDKACAQANYGPGCLKLDISYTDSNGTTLPKDGPHKNCKVDSQDPAMGTSVPTSRSVALDVICDPPSEPKKPSGSSHTGKGTTEGYQGK